MDDGHTLRDSLESLAAADGPFEVVLVTAPEPFSPEAGIRSVPGGSEISFALSSLQSGKASDQEGLTHIGELTLVLNPQVATALHSFLTVLLQQAPAQRRTGGTLLPMATFDPSAENEHP